LTNTPLDRTARDMLADLRSGATSATALAKASLDRIGAMEPNLHAWAFIDHGLVIAQAEAADARRAAGETLGALHGLPVGVKDIYDTADLPTENGTPAHRGRRPEIDAVMVARLRAAGAVIIGKTVTSELAVYTPGPTRNPLDLTRTPGGSSSGSAAAVAARMVPLALATQTNGSTIRPASFCGVVGYKPSLGLLPRTGVLKQSSMLDQPGLMARDVGDVALIADALIGPDPSDEQSIGLAMPRLADAATRSGRPPRFAYVRSPYWSRVDAAAQETLEAFVAGLGGAVEVVNLPPEFGDASAIHTTIMSAGIAEAFGADYVRAKELLSPVITGIVERGQKISAVEFVAALSARSALRQRFMKIAAPYDAIITPAALGIAPKFEVGTGDPIMSTIWTVLGAPALTLPLLSGAEGMPLGVQLVGNLCADAELIRAAAWLEGQSGRA
jgi:Asp-tRNA(Asn)/Glu-tRNA(Gln) amidotransferase A subunit family amidase